MIPLFSPLIVLTSDLPFLTFQFTVVETVSAFTPMLTDEQSIKTANIFFIVISPETIK